ncbi:MOSC domain-containing protein [Fulvivirgaceae bacterium BMA10]|uniref:MOSC domain-containing protein n=1 Tax=Splendidivirga corallicola TaxID=3051826 RepID=A0ABT8KS05_9BACT|nr:MOSC domain-containing protein [Fulvivirgaceae bacterium BMA10]
MSKLVLSQINVYPIKSLGGFPLKRAKLTRTGFEHDRKWMLINTENTFMTQRKYPQMSLVSVEVHVDFLLLKHKTKNLETFKLPVTEAQGELIEVGVWNDICEAVFVGKEIDQWLSEALDQPCRLVQMPEATHRYVEKEYAKNNETVGFADAYPFLMIGEESLNDLNGRLKEAVPMNRFRPNLVFSGGEPYIEDKFHEMRIGGQSFHAVKPCARCVLLTVNQQTGEKGSEPLKTLSTYRKNGNSVYFGQNLLHQNQGTVAVGDSIEVLSWK